MLNIILLCFVGDGTDIIGLTRLGDPPQRCN